MKYTRREVLAGLGVAGVGAAFSTVAPDGLASSLSHRLQGKTGSCPFRLAVINDEIAQDFEKACQIVSGEFGLGWIELRSMWDKNVTALNDKELTDAKKILAQ